jgi:hypothetical protein
LITAPVSRVAGFVPPAKQNDLDYVIAHHKRNIQDYSVVFVTTLCAVKYYYQHDA